MTETQAKAGAAGADSAGTPAKPSQDAVAPPGSKGTASGGAGTAGRADSAGGSATGSAPVSGPGVGAGSATGERSVVGRATVPGEKSASGGTKYRRPAGMPAPPDSTSVPSQSGSGGLSSASSVNAAAQTSTIPAVARASVRAGGGAGYGLGGLTTPGSTSGPAGAARVTEAVRAARATVSAAVGRGPRRARLHVKRIDPWSVMKFSFAVSFVLLVVVIVATSVLYLALDAMGVFHSINKALQDIVGATGTDNNATPPKVTAYGVIGGAFIVGVVNVVLFTALSTLGAFIYNVCADLVGGVELTLAEKD